MTKTRHYNLTFVIIGQTTKFLLKNLKRMCTDVVLYKGCGEEDFKDLMKEVRMILADLQIPVLSKVG